MRGGKFVKASLIVLAAALSPVVLFLLLVASLIGGTLLCDYVCHDCNEPRGDLCVLTAAGLLGVALVAGAAATLVYWVRLGRPQRSRQALSLYLYRKSQ